MVYVWSMYGLCMVYVWSLMSYMGINVIYGH